VRARLLEAPPVASASADEVFIHALAAELAGARHVAVGSASPLPAAAAWLAHALSGGALRVAMLGGRDVFFTEGGRELFDCAARGRIDAFFLSGGQIDGEANINLVQAEGRRFPGSFGSAGNCGGWDSGRSIVICANGMGGCQRRGE